MCNTNPNRKTRLVTPKLDNCCQFWMNQWKNICRGSNSNLQVFQYCLADKLIAVWVIKIKARNAAMRANPKRFRHRANAGNLLEQAGNLEHLLLGGKSKNRKRQCDKVQSLSLDQGQPIFNQFGPSFSHHESMIRKTLERLNWND